MHTLFRIIVFVFLSRYRVICIWKTTFFVGPLPHMLFSKLGCLHFKVVSCFHIYCLVSVHVRAVLARP